MLLGLLVLSTDSPGQAPTDQTPSPPSWQGSRAGLGDEVLAPWTPVTVTGDRFGVWGRTYRLGALPLPCSAIARDAELLASPVTLSGMVEGKPIVWNGAAASPVEVKPALVRLRSKSVSDALACEGEVVIEYDGMIRCDLRVSPTRGKATIERLCLEVPLAAGHALFLHTWPGRWGSAANSTALPKEGYHGPFKPFVWLGDHQRGLAWFSPSDQDCFPAAPDRVMEIEGKDGKVTLRINLVGKPQTIERPLSYTFGFQATPVKPPAPDAWDYRTVHMGGYGLKDAVLDKLADCGVRTMCFHEHWTDIQNYPKTTHGEDLKRLVAACHKRKIQLLVYFGYEMSNIAPEWDRYSQECLVSPRKGGYHRKPEQKAYVVCYQSHWQDFLAEGIDRVMTEFGIDGVYLDGTSEPWDCANTQHGCGYRKPDGKVGLTYSLFATRQMMKRIYTIVKRRNPAGQVNVHQSTCMTIPTLAFATSYWDGEQLQSVKRKDSAAMKVLPLDAFCAEFMGHNWGVPAELLWYDGGPFRRVEAVSLGLLHDVPVRPLRSMADVETTSRLWKTFDAFGRHEATWIPYWSSGQAAQTNTNDVKVSLYNRPGKGLIAVVVNTGSQPCQAEITFDKAVLRQGGPLTAHDVINDKPLPSSDGSLRLPLGTLEHAVVWLKSP